VADADVDEPAHVRVLPTRLRRFAVFIHTIIVVKSDVYLWATHSYTDHGDALAAKIFINFI